MSLALNCLFFQSKILCSRVQYCISQGVRDHGFFSGNILQFGNNFFSRNLSGSPIGFCSQLRPRLSPQEVTEILRHNESTIHISGGPEITLSDINDGDEFHHELSHVLSHSVAYVDTNQLASNTPIEDKLSAARCLHTTGFLFGVFDGHGGAECSQVVSKRLFDYIAAALLPKEELRKIVAEWESGNHIPLTYVYNDPFNFVAELQRIYDHSLLRYCRDLLSRHDDFSMEAVFVRSFQCLDTDLSREVRDHKETALHEILLRVALSGSVACVAHVDGPHLHLANAGDCGAVLGVQPLSPGSGWRAQRLTTDHTWENPREVKRLLGEHPVSEAKSVIRDQRLLGMLMPFRAFGDYRFKWDRLTQSELMTPLVPGGGGAMPRSFLTPPYLTVIPEVTHHYIRPHERFLLMSSDGLWECLSASDAVSLCGEYLCGRQTLTPVRLPRRVTLDEITTLLERREQGLHLKPADSNAATHLIRHALGGTEAGLDHSRLAHSLTMPVEERRLFRDDISVHLVFFDADFLRVCPAEN